MVLLLVVPVPEGLELLLVLLGDREPELLEPPRLLPLLLPVLAGGARKKKRGKIELRKPGKRTTEELTSGNLDLEVGSSGINVAMVGWVNELDGISSSTLQGHICDGITLRRTVSLALR